MTAGKIVAIAGGVAGAGAAAVALVLAAPLIALGSLFGGLFGGSGGPTVAVGPALHPPASVVAVDEAVTAKPAWDPCGLPASLLLAQQDEESGWSPTALSPTGAEGIAQFEPGTWPSWATVGPGGANPPSPWNVPDAAAAEARFVCALEKAKGSITKALYAYNCGPAVPFGIVPGCADYAANIIAIAGRIHIPAPTPKVGRP